MVTYFLTVLKSLLNRMNSHISPYFWRKDFPVTDYIIFYQMMSLHFFLKVQDLFLIDMLSYGFGSRYVLPITKNGIGDHVRSMRMLLAVHYSQPVGISWDNRLLILFLYYMTPLFSKYEGSNSRKNGFIWSCILYELFICRILLPESK